MVGDAGHAWTPDLPLQRFMDDVFRAHPPHRLSRRRTAGVPVGLITFRDAAAARQRSRRLRRPGPDDAARRRAWSSSRRPARGGVAELLGSPLGRALVLDAGRPPGLLSATDVSRILDAQQRGAPGPPLRRAAA